MTVTRFAPSPTGKLHVGNLRPALLNWLFARKAGGTFILRIDDTDAERSKEEYVDAAKRDLDWLGLGWDRFERQSERLGRYDEVADALRSDERLYPAFETGTELNLKRKYQLQAGRPPVYDRMSLDPQKRAAYEAEGRVPHWRFKLAQERVTWVDTIRGDVSVDCASVSDPVLIREDGGYLYTLCSVVDDADFGVTHVIRGEDHVTNTATQIQIFEAIGERPTGFAHHSLLVDTDGSGLSKRLGSLTLESLREAGVEPMALLSLMARLGTSEPIEPRVSHEDLIAGFDLDSFGRAPARFSTDELRGLSAKVLHAAPYEMVAQRAAAHGVDAHLWGIVRENVETLDDLAFWRGLLDAGVAPVIEEADAEYVRAAFAQLPETPWTPDTWKDWTNALKAETGRKGRALFRPLRLAFTGRDYGPFMGDLLPLFSEEAVRNLRARLNDSV